jgi:hypothetical protein
VSQSVWNWLYYRDETSLAGRDIKCSIGLKKCMPNGNIQQCQWLSLDSSSKHRLRTDEDRLIGQIGWNTPASRGHVQGLMGRRRVNIDSGRIIPPFSL